MEMHRDHAAYSFDALAVHPQPEPLESFTSYLTRLAEANHIPTCGALLRFVGINERENWKQKVVKDLPQTSFGQLPQLAVCTQAELRRLTFYHLGEKFGRPAAPQAMSVFLRDALGDVLRYCPVCLAERKYYSLLWRFDFVSGCAVHGCRLLEQCGHCQQRLPVFGPVLKIGLCPICQHDLQACAADLLSEAEQQRAQRQTEDLIFLLGDQTRPLDEGDQALRVGQQFMVWRELKGVTRAEAARGMKSDPEKLRFLEYGVQGHGLKFIDYIDYATYLEVRLPTLFATSVEPEALNRIQRKRKGTMNEEEVIGEALQAIDQLKSEGKRVSQQAIRSMIGMIDSPLGRYPRLKKLLEGITANQPQYRALASKHREKVWVKQTPRVLEEMLCTGQRLTRRELAKRLSAPRDLVGRNPEIAAMFEKAVAQWRVNRQHLFQKQEDEMVERVEQAIRELETRRQPITDRAIGELLDVCPVQLWWYPRVRALLAKDPNSRLAQRQTKEKKIMSRVKEAIRQLKKQNQPVIVKAISRAVGISPTTLYKYPEVKRVFQRMGEGVRRKRKRAAGLREAAMLEKVKEALQRLKSTGQQVTLSALGKSMGMTVPRLRHYSKVAALLKQIADEGRQRRQQQSRQSEKHLLDRVPGAIEKLKAAGQPLSCEAIARELKVNRARLDASPRVWALLKTFGATDRSIRLTQAQAREANLIRCLEKTVRKLQARGQRLTQEALAKEMGLTPKGLGYYPRVRAALEQVIQRGKLERPTTPGVGVASPRSIVLPAQLRLNEPPDPNWHIPDTLWHEIEVWLPPALTRPYHSRQGNRTMMARQVMDAVFYVLRMDRKWSGLPQDWGVQERVYSRFHRWLRAGVFVQLWEAGVLAPEKIQGVSRNFYDRLWLI